jgi:hypothetical protein
MLCLAVLAAVLICGFVGNRKQEEDRNKKEAEQAAAGPTTVVVNTSAASSPMDETPPQQEVNNKAPVAPPPNSNRDATGQAARMNELNKMARDGTISEEEFERKKTEIWLRCRYFGAVVNINPCPFDLVFM